MPKPRAPPWRRDSTQPASDKSGAVHYLLSQHYQCRVTMPLLHQQLQDLGILISAGQISALVDKAANAVTSRNAEGVR
jgi:hypothetical protein